VPQLAVIDRIGASTAPGSTNATAATKARQSDRTGPQVRNGNDPGIIPQHILKFKLLACQDPTPCQLASG
jgi:hypothetical protein